MGKNRENPAKTSRVEVLFAAALRHHQEGRLAEAQALYRQVLDIVPRHADSLHLLGLSACQGGRYQEGAELISRAVAADGTSPLYRCNLGAALKGSGRPAEALAAYDAAIRLQPDYAEAHYNRANTLKDLGRDEDALAAYGAAVGARPDYAEAHYNRALLLDAHGRLEEAVRAYDATSRLRPVFVDAHFRRGAALNRLGRFAEALTAFDEAIRLKPDLADAHNNRGTTLKDLGRLEEAVAAYLAALRLKPDFPDAHCSLGGVLRQLERFDQSLEHLDAAIALKPDLAEAYYNRGTTFSQQERLEAALADFDAAIRLKPDFAEAHCNRGLVLENMGHLNEALCAFDAALELNPGYLLARFNRSFVLFTLGRLEEGWADFEMRWKADARKTQTPPRPFPQPWWQGESLAGKELLLWCEQGIADEVLAASMIADAVPVAGHCVVECESRLVPLFARSFPAVEVVARADPPSPRLLRADVQLPLLSLGGFFRKARGDFPDRSDYLRADPELAARWRGWLDGLGQRVTVGVSWTGRMAATTRSRHFAPLEALAPVFAIPGVAFVDLQYDRHEEDIARIEALSGAVIHRPPGLDLTGDLDGVAALICGLDAVVGPCTAGNMIAGALGRPGWVYASHPGASQKETFDGGAMPWYPSVRLFTCPLGGDWTGVIADLAGSLRRHVEDLQK